jgi:hypothetical protein
MSVVVEMSGLRVRAEAHPKAASRLAADASQTDNVVRLWNACPHSEEMSAYDLRNMSLYAILLEAEYEGASTRHMAETFFRIRVDRRPVWAFKVVQTHLARAHWLKENVYPLLHW